ncbi:MAG TPA: hypothetical protein VFE33_30300 [Thermoanaerobaculia bacterium]|nr:hypothetical protein [Thermoanaerobaculia bacterium]
MNRQFSLRSVVLVLLLGLSATAPSFAAGAAGAGGTGLCPAIHRPIPSVEERQHLPPIEVMRCYMSIAEIDTVESAIGHDPQTTVTDPAFDSGELNPDGTSRPPLTAAQVGALLKMHSILDPDMRAGAILRKFVQSSDVGGILYGRTVITSGGKPLVVTTDTVRGFVGLERNTQGLTAGETLAALGLDFETTSLGQFTDRGEFSYYREVALEILRHGLHSIRHVMSAQGAHDAKIPLGKDLNDAVPGGPPNLAGRSFEMDRQGQLNPYTALGISDEIVLLTLRNHDGLDMYRLHLNEEDVMTVPTPLTVGDVLFRRLANGAETPVATYLAVKNADGTTTNRWVFSRHLSHNLAVYYSGLVQQAAARVAAAGASG